MLGTIGEHNRLDTTVLSDAVNVSRRLQALSADYGVDVLASGEASKLTDSSAAFYARFADVVRLKGRETPTTVYEIAPPTARDEKNETDTIYREAFDALQGRDIDTAESRILECVEANPDDVIYAMLHRRINDYKQHGFPSGWDGVVVRTSK